ncbi:DUF503 domain-containing protein [Geobacter pickeringii]|uniref:DUF503 domain-containing protein n=1 Tax=Geobacter pickeringii TaxID=345632 RepID=A0A0B5B8F7_9BACT|nr:DUF503 domain-containing protein [Geobacter pickeringii]AJE02948.1 hypothetical protein GPICK_05845 [Geobacter pickeringii]
MFVHSLTIHLFLPSHSLKGKRGIVKSILARVRNGFNVSAAEVDLQDVHGEALLGFAVVTPSRAAGRHLLERVEEWIAEERPDVEIAAAEIEER